MNRVHAISLLQGCRTLSDAETKLAALTPIPSRAARWGLWDGWSGRPSTTAGLILGAVKPGNKDVQKVEDDYDEACELGRNLAMCETPS